MTWVWIDEEVVLAIHDRQLAEYGGSTGIRDNNLLLSALARPQHAESYNPGADAATLAAAYGYGIARNHPFIDGNKRTATAVLATFLRLNGFRLSASEAAIVVTMIAVAEGSLSEEDFAGWIRKNNTNLEQAKAEETKRKGRRG